MPPPTACLKSVYHDLSLKNVGLRGERQREREKSPKRAGGGRHRVRQVEGGSHQAGGACLRLRYCPGIQKRRAGKRVLGESWRGGAWGSGVNRPGSMRRFLLLGRGRDIGEMRETGTTDGMKWSPGEHGGRVWGGGAGGGGAGSLPGGKRDE